MPSHIMHGWLYPDCGSMMLTSMSAGTQNTISLCVATRESSSSSGVGRTGGVLGLNIVQTTPV